MSSLRTKIRPPALAEMWGVGVDKVLHFIHTGELRAFDASLNRGTGKPRWLIDLVDVAAFEKSREATPPVSRAKPRRRRRDVRVREYF